MLRVKMIVRNHIYVHEDTPPPHTHTKREMHMSASLWCHKTVPNWENVYKRQAGLAG